MERQRRFLLVLALVGLVSACEPIEQSQLGSDARRSLTQGRGDAAAWIAEGRGPQAPDREVVIALGYLERLRLGLGSPFRLMEYAASDPRLSARDRARLVRTLATRTVDQQSYQMNPAALDCLGAGARPCVPGLGRHHFGLIRDAIVEARDPRSGELAVRLAYTLAAGEGSVAPGAPELASQAAALLRDRRLAQLDAIALLRAAESGGGRVDSLVSVWRANRRFLVERPAMEPLAREAEREAMELAPRLAEAIRGLSLRLSDGQLDLSPRGRPVPLLSPAAARTLAALADSLNAPPQTPLVVAIDVQRRELLEQPDLMVDQLLTRERFVQAPRNEERFVAEHALLVNSDPAVRPVAARIALWGSIAMRAYAQEQVWFPGFAGPSARELSERYGLSTVSFDEGIEPSWRPYYRRMLDQALSDMQRVLPALDLHGLNVHFGDARGRGTSLAVHDPKTRTVYFPPATGAGTIAHEIAHDLDWQVALRRYRVRGDYGTDRATRNQNDRLAVSLRGLASGALLPPGPGETPTHARRPAEVFARSVDWFVVAALAREGRTNGYLSSVQDDMLTGYGTVRPPDVTGGAGAALVTVLDEVAPIYADTRRWFLESYGPARSLTSYDLARRVLEASGRTTEPWPLRSRTLSSAENGDFAYSVLPTAEYDALSAAREEAFAAIDAWVCRDPGAAYDPRLEAARRRLVAHVAGARARGIALSYAENAGGPVARNWAVRQFYGGPWATPPVDSASAEVLQLVVEEARSLSEAEVPSSARGFQLPGAPSTCAPLLSVPGQRSVASAS